MGLSLGHADIFYNDKPPKRSLWVAGNVLW